MAATGTDTAAATSGEVGVPRRRGKSKAPNFKYTGPMSVIRLELDLSDERTRRRLERHWRAVFRLRRALQRDAQARCRAYWAAHHERQRDPKALRERLGLTRKGIEAAAKAHIEASGWMRDHLTKAVGLRVGDEVWETVDRHLFPDASGRRHGPPRIGWWWEFTRIPGRACSHTRTTPTWETYRLVGTLDGHLGAYRHPGLPAAVSAAGQAACRPAGTSILAQPPRLAPPARPASGSWADHTGALAVVFTGLPGWRRGVAGAAAPGCRAVGAPVPSPGRPEHLAQDHGNTITAEDCRISIWARLWGKRIALFSPGMLVTALAAECAATGGRLYRAGTRTTALSQHCLCGNRVPKTLAQRTHDCDRCGLQGDRDVTSTMLAACVELTDPDDPRTARIDFDLAHALLAWLASQQEWEGSINRHQPPAPVGPGPARTGSHHPVAPAEQAALGPPPNRPSRKPGRRGTSRKEQPPKLFGAA